MGTEAASTHRQSVRFSLLKEYAESYFGTRLCLSPVAGDASFRSYFRGRVDGGTTFIAMDSPPEQENLSRFLKVRGLMERSGLHVPRVYAADCNLGFALVSDLGEQTYLQFISTADESNISAVMNDALNALVLWQKQSMAGCLPDYDHHLIYRELSLFSDWYVRRHANLELSPSLEKRWEEVKEALVEAATDQTRVFVHRDFTVRNLVVSSPNPGIIDFQDAVYGPVTYDLVSLLLDAYVSWPECKIKGWMKDYFELAKSCHILTLRMGWDEFNRAFDLMSMQRHLKVIGIFSRLAHRDKKYGYLKEISRFLCYIRRTAGKYEPTSALIEILDFLQDRVAK